MRCAENTASSASADEIFYNTDLCLHMSARADRIKDHLHKRRRMLESYDAYVAAHARALQ